MTRFIRAGLLAALMGLPTAARTAPPKLTGTSPLGVQRGETTEVEFQGSALGDHPRLVAPFAVRIEQSAGRVSISSAWKVRLTVDAGTAVGVYAVRVATEWGVSNPVLFAVGQLPQWTELESNNTVDTAQPIGNPCVIEGKCPSNDDDFFSFRGRKGARVVVDALCCRIGSGVDPMIRLTAADGRFVAAADDSPGLFTDSYLTAVLPQDGKYVLEFCDSRFAGPGRAVYRLLIGKVPFAREVYPLSVPRGQDVTLRLSGGTLSGDRLFAVRTPSDPLLATFYPRIPARLLGDPAWADSELDLELPAPVVLGDAGDVLEPADPARKLPALSPPVTVLGRLAKAGERDEYTLAAPPGSKHEVRVEAWGLGSALDGVLRVIGKDGRILGETDDGKSAGRRRGGGGGRRSRAPFTADPAFDLTMPSGQEEVRLVVKDLMDRGGVGFTYRLVVRPVEGDFQLALADEQVAIPRGGTALIPVTVTRTGYRGPIALDVRGVRAEDGITIIPTTVAAGQTNGVVGLRASAESAFLAREVQVVGKGEDGRTVAASKTIVFAQQTIATPGFGMSGTIPSYARPVVSLVAAVTRPGPILLDAGTAKVVVPRGSTVEVTIPVVRTVKENKAYSLTAMTPPPGLSVAATSIGASATSVLVKLTAASDTPLGSSMVALVAQDPSRRAAPAQRKGGDDEDAAPPQTVPPIAATMFAVEVVQPGRPK
jgi:hypothetical protein